MSDKWVKIKDPDAVLDYLADWATYLGDDTIVDSDWDVYDNRGVPITGSDFEAVAIDDMSFADTTATVWLSGGVVGAKYIVTCHITTDGGRQDDRSLYLTIKEM